MTADAQQPEYIITETMVKRIMQMIWIDQEPDPDEAAMFEVELRSRPHTPAPSPKITHIRFERDGLHYRIDNGIEDIISLSDHDAATARAATLSTLDKIEKFRNEISINAIMCGDGWENEKEYLVSLRQEAQQC